MATSDTRTTKWYFIVFALISSICECRGAPELGVHYGDCSAPALVVSVSGPSPRCIGNNPCINNCLANQGYKARRSSDEEVLVHYWPLYNGNRCHGWETKDEFGNRLFMSAKDIRCAGKDRITYTEFYGSLKCNGTDSSTMNKSLTTNCTAGSPLTSFELLTDASACSHPKDYCGNCYIGKSKPCCNTCASVKQTYEKKGWKLNTDNIAQCRHGGLGTQPRLVHDYKMARPGQATYEDGVCCNGCSSAGLASVSYRLSLSLIFFSFFSLT